MPNLWPLETGQCQCHAKISGTPHALSARVAQELTHFLFYVSFLVFTEEISSYSIQVGTYKVHSALKLKTVQ